MFRVTFLLNVFVILLVGSAADVVQSENTAPRRRVTQPPTFLQGPQRIHYFVSRDQPANLTWVVSDVCKIQIKCNGKKFVEGDARVCGKTCNRCRTRKRTKIITVSDFPQNVRSMTCQCKVWGMKAVRTDKIIVEKAFLRRNFSTVQLKYVAFPNTTVELQCKPPGGSPRPNITWYKDGEPVFPKRDRRMRVTSKQDLVIKQSRSSDSGVYQCVAENMAARREGPVMILEVRVSLSENTTVPAFNESQLLCSNHSSATCSTGCNASSRCNTNTSNCDENNGGCAHLCTYLSFGRLKCFCEEGYKLDEDGKSCGEIKLTGEGSSKRSDQGILLVVSVILVTIIAIIITFCMLMKRFSRQADPPDIPREHTREVRETDDESLATDHTDLMRAGSQMNNDSPDLNEQICSDEPSAVNAASEDSSVKLQRSVVVYMTKVEVEQHGGVTIVGDEAKVHHHYPPHNQ